MEKNSKNNLPVKDWIKHYKKQFKRFEKYYVDNDWRYSEDLRGEYESQMEICKVVLNRLNYFIKKYEPYLKYKYVQDFILVMRVPIDLYTERYNEYINRVDWTLIKDRQESQSEMLFQSNMMIDFNTIKDKLQDLDLDNEVITLDLPIHSDKKIPFLMSKLVEESYPEIVTFKEAVLDEKLASIPNHTLYELQDTTEFFINMKNPPKYNSSLHYFEQDQVVLDFYEEELKKIRNGLNIAGVYIHGWLYWHINYFKTDMPMAMFKGTPLFDATEEKITHQPMFRDNELFLADCYKEADDQNLGLFIFGTRRAGKTVIESSILTWRTTVVKNSESIVIGGDEGDLDKLSKTLEIGFSNVNPAFRLTRNTNDWSKHIQFGLKDKAGIRIPYSDIFIKNVNSGNKRASLKTAGATPTAWIVDEAGKFDCKKMYKQAIPSFQNPSGWGVVPILTGTGGEVEMSVDAQEMLTNPKVNQILPMDWEKLESYVKEEDLVTWERRDFGIFMPAQMSFKEGLMKEDSSLAEFFGIDDEKLSSIELKVTNWEKALEIINEHRLLLKDKKTDLNDEKMGYPLDPMECFLHRIDNPFPAKEAQNHIDYLVKEGGGGRAVDMFKKRSNILSYSFSDKELATYPFQGGNINAPVLMFEAPPEDNLIDGTYVAGLDHYKHDKASTDSVGALYIFKRNVNLDEWSNRIVASYCSRPDSIDTFNETCEMLLEGYGAECLQENADISLQQHLRRKHKDGILLANGEELARKFVNAKASQNNKYGLNPNTKNQQYILNLVISYCHEDIEIGQDEEGFPINVKGVTRIDDIELLKEIVSFKYVGNYDRIISFGHALAWARYLDSMNIMPKVKKKRDSNYYQKQRRKQLGKSKSMYSTHRTSPYR